MPESSSSAVVTRFAPSPTGYLHVGGARTALFNWLLARHTGGKFLLRIEDTDLARSTEQATTQLLEDLRWLGLLWDNQELIYQSRRTDFYNRVIDQLIAQDKAYRAYETPEELEAMRRQAESRRQSFVYRRPMLSPEQLRACEAQGRPHVVRFAMPVRDYSFEDKILGRIDLPASQVQDFVIRKADGMPTYHLAVVVDDAAMGITHVIRGQEHTLNTFLHIALQEALGYPRPVYAHLPVILNKEDGKKMGKRDRDRKIRQQTRHWLSNTGKSVQELSAACGLEAGRLNAWLQDEQSQLDLDEQKRVMQVIGLKESDLPEILVHDFRKNGYLPEALLNFLALLGWNPGGDRERMSLQEMIQLFSLEQVHKAPARFDRQKLLAFNTEAVANASPQRLVAAMRDYLSVNPDSPLNQASDEQLAAILAMKKGFRVLREVDQASRFLLQSDEQIVYDPQAVEKVLRQQRGLEVLQDILPRLSELTDWTHHSLEAAVNAYCQEKQLSLAKVAQPIRVAVSGGTVSPPIFQSLEFLGPQRTLARIRRAIAVAQS
ncbi:MAG TPA: glutamate--tRNA ligase [Tepidisphaeraceae bacterium]|nr:glutamate--tRNA ligase [Tepidisphaeraceae bacterium]